MEGLKVEERKAEYRTREEIKRKSQQKEIKKKV